MKQKSVGLTLRAVILALVLSLVAGTPVLPPLEGVAYAQSSGTGLTAQVAPDNSSVSLSWNAVTDADSYEIWRGPVVNNVAQWGTSAYATVTGEDTTTYTDSSVTAGTTYAYAVRSVTDGTAATWSGPYPNVTIGGGTAAPTAAPTVTVAGGSTSTSVSVSWTDVTGATGYQIQYWHAGLNDWMLISGDQTSPYEHTGLTTGTQYYYVVRGSNSGGNGPWSNWRTDDSQITLAATTAVPVITLDHQSRTVVGVSWTESAAGSRYDLQRRRVVTSTDNADPPETTTLDTTAANGSTDFERLPSALLTAASYTDSAANFIAPVDTTAATHSVMYEYRVRAVDSANQEGNWSAVKSVTIPRASAVLPAPTGLSVAAVSSSNLNVTWNNVAGADYYQIQWKSGDGSFSTSIRVNRSAGTNSNYNDTNLSPSTKYTYRVQAVNINGPGDWSSEVSRTTLSVTAEAGQMPKVTGLMVDDTTTSNTADERKAKLTWTAVSNATHYELQRYDPSTAAGWQNLDATPADGVTRIAATSSPSHTDTFASGAAGNTYFYVVSAVNSGVDKLTSTDDGGNDTNNADNEMGEWSDYKSVTFKAHKPNAPTSLAAVKTSGTSILVSWTAPESVAESGAMRGSATAYTLEWKTNDSTTRHTMAVTGTSYHHTGLRGTTAYSYRVKARNTGGESAYTAPVSVTLGNTLSSPSGLTVVDATTTSGGTTTYRLKVSWNAVSGASSYEIQRFNATADPPVWGDLDGTADGETPVPSGTTHTDNITAGAGQTLLYRVRTVKEAAIKSDWSAAVSGTTKAATATAPTLVATSTGMSMIRLSWTAVTGATGFEIEFLKGSYATEALFGAANLNRSKITVSGGSHRNYVHTGRTAGTRYSYRIRAKLAQGGYTGWSSATATPIRQYTKPARPDLSATTTVSNTMTLKWDAVKFWTDVQDVGAEGHLTDANNYQIQRKKVGTAEWVPVVSTAATCTNNKCEFTDGVTEALEANTQYYYRIRATVSRGTITYNSYWDMTKQRTTQ